MTRWLRNAAATVLSVTVGGSCVGNRVDDRAARSDSAGITIVQSREPQWLDSASWRVAADPTLEIGVTAGDSAKEFNRIRRAVRFSSGNMAVANGQPPVIRVFDADGDYVRSIGRQGDGPGEFRSLDWIEIAGDTILALDARARRITAFMPDGSVAWLISIREGVGAPSAGPLRLDDGTFIVHHAQSDALTRVAVGTDQPGQTLRNTSALGHYDRTGLLVDSVFVGQGSESAVILRGGRPAMMPAPFARDLTYALWNRSVFIGTQDAYEIREYAASGELRTIVRWDGPALAMTSEDIESLKSHYLDQVRGNVQAEQSYERLFAEVPFPPAKPAYGRVLVDPLGQLWVAALAFSPTPPDDWTVFATSHELLGQVRVPSGLHVFEVGTDYLLGQWRDQAGVEYVRLHSLARREP